MTTLPILLYPSPAIRRKPVPVTSIDGGLQRLIDNMIETMYKAPGVGLAAPCHHIFISTLAFALRPCSHSLNFASAF